MHHYFTPFFRMLVCIICFSLIGENALAQTLVINEFMASNSSTLADEDGDYEDWIELYNYGAAPVNLEGFGLTDDTTNPFKWKFPDYILEPGEFLLVWASGKNRFNPLEPMHTNFSVSSSGEELQLNTPLGDVLDYVPPIALPSDISRGRKPDGEEQWFYFDKPSPGQPNDTPSFGHIWSPPVFSHGSGFYTTPFDLSISTGDSDAMILYTMDGSEPEADNLGGTTFRYKKSYPQYPGNPPGDLFIGSFQTMIYETSIPVYDKSEDRDSITHISSAFEFNPYYFPKDPVFKGTVIRARVTGDGGIPGPVITHVFFVHPEGRERYPLTVLNLSTNPAALFDYDTGIYNPGIDFDQWRQANPNAVANGGRPGNYHRRGNEWEYPGHLVLFEPDQPEPSLHTNMGYRTHGGWSRSFPQKSLRLYARNRYGNSHFEHSVFPEQQHTRYKRLILRNSGNDYYYTKFRDAAQQKLISPLRFDTQDYRPALLFVNGEFWGLQNIRERYDKHYLERVYGADPDNIDLLSGDVFVKEGDAEHYLETLLFMDENSLAQAEHYQYIQTRIDTDNYIDYQIANIFVSNTDWPGNNIDFWRLRTDSFLPDAPYGLDGRWRWMAFDLDFGFGMYGGLPQHNTLEFAADPSSDFWGNPPWSTFLFRNMLLNEGFTEKFVTRFSDLLNTLFLPDYVNRVIDEMAEEIESVMPENILRWKRPPNMNEWHHNINIMKSFVTQRPGFQWLHLKDFFGLTTPVTLNLDVSAPDQGYIQVNTVAIHPDTPGVSANPLPWEGSYFPDIPITLIAIPERGYLFSHWSGDINSTETILSINPTKDIRLKAHFTIDEQTSLIHFWYFNTAIPNNMPLQEISSWFSATTERAVMNFHSALIEYPFNSEHPYWRKASMERRNAPTEINYRPEGNDNHPYNLEEMRGIQIKQPFAGDAGENQLIFHLPALQYKDLLFRFAAKDEYAAESLMVEYSVSAQEPDWISFEIQEDELLLNSEYMLFTLDFSDTDNTAGNPDFKIRLRFNATDPFADDGHRVSFNNFSLEGNFDPTATNLTAGLPEKRFTIRPNPVSRHQALWLDKAQDIRIYDLSGRKLVSLKQVEKIPMHSLKPGTYIIQNTEGSAAKIVVLP